MSKVPLPVDWCPFPGVPFDTCVASKFLHEEKRRRETERLARMLRAAKASGGSVA